MNPDSYNFTAECPYCNQKRGVSCSRAQVKTGEPVRVYAVACNHHWTMTPEDSKELRDNTSVLKS